MVVYVGDSATLSFLQLIRMIVEAWTGPSSFTLDPDRHKIMEAKSSFTQVLQSPQLLPDKTTAEVLARAYFTNVSFTVQNRL